jgi:hypothetical protein
MGLYSDNFALESRRVSTGIHLWLSTLIKLVVFLKSGSKKKANAPELLRYV